MTMTTASLMRAPMMGRWTSLTRPPGLADARSQPNTRPASSTSTTPCRLVRRDEERCCAGRVSTTSHIAEWRKARHGGGLEGLTAKGRKAKRSAEQVELDKVRRRAERLEAELARTKLALEITGKAHALLELLSESADCDPKSKP